MQTPIIQFGTSRFLQAHVDLFVSETLDVEQAIGPITVVKSTNGAERSQRLAGLMMEGGFPVIIRGIDGGHRVDREQRVHSVQRALCASDDWPIVERIFVEEVAFVVSNTSDQVTPFLTQIGTTKGACRSAFRVGYWIFFTNAIWSTLDH